MNCIKILLLALLPFFICISCQEQEGLFAETFQQNASSGKSNAAKPSLNLEVNFDGYESGWPASITNERKYWTLKSTPKDEAGNLIDINNNPDSFIKIWVYHGDESHYNFPYDKIAPTQLTFFGKYPLDGVIWTEADNPTTPILLGAFKDVPISEAFNQTDFMTRCDAKTGGDIDDAVIGDEFRFKTRSRASLQACSTCSEGSPVVYYVVFQLKHNGKTSKKEKFWFSNQ